MNQILSSSLKKADFGGTSTADALAWFDLQAEDREQAAELAPISDQVADEIIEDFYKHILRFESAAQQFSSDKQIERVKAGQKRYFSELISAKLDDAYIGERRRIGRIHEAAGITPTLYIGAYAYYLNRLGLLINQMMSDDGERALKLYLSLQKIAHFDMALALETYVEAREQTIEAQQREMSELPTPVLQLRAGLILIPVVGAMDTSRARMLTVALLEGIRQYRARAVVLDITGVAFVDSAVANHLIQATQAARLMGAKSVLTGVSAEVAQALVKIGVSNEALNTAGDLQSGIAEAEALLQTIAIQVPILRQASTLIASVQDALSDNDILELQARLLAEVVRTRARGVVIDVSSLDILDSFGTRMLGDIAAAAQLRGALTVIVGIQPEVALSMVLLGLTMHNVATALDLDAGLDLLNRRMAK